MNVSPLPVHKNKLKWCSWEDTDLRATERHIMGLLSVTYRLTPVRAPGLNPAKQAGARFTYSGRIEG